MVSEKYQELTKRDAIFMRLVGGGVAALMLSGCLATTPIEVEDTGVFQRAARASFNVNGGSRAAAETRSGHAIEIGYQGAKVSSIQLLSSGQPPVYHNNTIFSSPNQLSNRFDFSYADLSWRMREFGGGPFGIELLAGLGYSALGLSVTSPTQRAYQHFNTAGLQLGFGMILRKSTSSSIHARGTYYFSFDTGVSGITKYEIYYAKTFHKNLSLLAGYAEWYVSGSGDSGSDFKMHFNGPTLVLDFNFNLGN